METEELPALILFIYLFAYFCQDWGGGGGGKDGGVGEKGSITVSMGGWVDGWVGGRMGGGMGR